MQTYLQWLARILALMAIVCLALALTAYFSMSPSGLDGGGGIALLYAALVGTIGFGISAIAAHLIRKNISNS